MRPSFFRRNSFRFSLLLGFLFDARLSKFKASAIRKHEVWAVNPLLSQHERAFDELLAKKSSATSRLFLVCIQCVAHQQRLLKSCGDLGACSAHLFPFSFVP